MKNDTIEEVPFTFGPRRTPEQIAESSKREEKQALHRIVKRYRLALENRDFVAMANLAALCIQTMSEKHGYQYAVEHFGACPECLKTDGCYHVGRAEWFVCHEHKVKWFAGSNLFSAWRDMTDEQFEANAEMLTGYRDIEPIHLVEGPNPESETGIRPYATVVEGPRPKDKYHQKHDQN